MKLYAIRRRGGWDTPEELEAAAARSKQVGDEEMSDDIRWIRSYVVQEPDGELGAVCIYQRRARTRSANTHRVPIFRDGDLRDPRHADRSTGPRGQLSMTE